MLAPRKYALVDIQWLPLPSWLKYPAGAEFGLTGYREADGPAGMFSVYVKRLGGDLGAGSVQAAKLYALAEAMCDRLPQIGTKFMLTTGSTIVAECSTRSRGEDDE